MTGRQHLPWIRPVNNRAPVFTGPCWQKALHEDVFFQYGLSTTMICSLAPVQTTREPDGPCLRMPVHIREHGPLSRPVFTMWYLDTLESLLQWSGCQSDALVTRWWWLFGICLYYVPEETQLTSLNEYIGGSQSAWQRRRLHVWYTRDPKNSTEWPCIKHPVI